MDLVTLLFGLRLLSGLLLIAFVGVIAWLIYRELAQTASVLSAEYQAHGSLRVITNESDEPPVDAVFPLLPVTSIGRAASNTIVLQTGYASADHALILRRDGQWWLQDQGSRNGTLLNELPVADTAVISPGDIIAIGGTKLKIEF